MKKYNIVLKGGQTDGRYRRVYGYIKYSKSSDFDVLQLNLINRWKSPILRKRNKEVLKTLIDKLLEVGYELEALTLLRRAISRTSYSTKPTLKKKL